MHTLTAMTTMNSFSASYQHNQIFTASPEELILMLYNGALRFVHLGQEALRRHETAAARYHLLRGEKIIHYLNLTLNLEAGGAIAENLARLYHFINRQLSAGALQGDTEKVEQAAGILGELRDAWQEAHGRPGNPAA